MKTFTRLLPLLCLAFFMMNCATYQYATIGSNLKANEQQEYIVENDSLMIRYSFSGAGGPMNMIIHNKSNQPLYIDWTRSALVLNDQSSTYWQNRSSIAATAETVQTNWSPWTSTSSSSITGQIMSDEPGGFIAPNSFKKFSQFVIDNNFKMLKSSDKQHRVKIKTSTGTASALRFAYQKEDSPLKFRNYLTLSRDPSFVRPLVYDNEFWLAEVLQTTVPPRRYLHEGEDHNKYYNTGVDGSGVLIGVFGVLLLVGAMNAN